MPTLTNGFVLGTLFLLASGHIIYDAPLCRQWWSKSTGYGLYFRIIFTGLSLVSGLALLLYVPPFHSFPLFGVALNPEHAPVLAFAIALAFRLIAAIGIQFYGWSNPDGKYKLNLKNLNEKGLDQIIYEKIYANEMIMVTLENNKVYTGWPLEAPNNEDSNWLRLIPEWSGYRDEKANIYVETDYSEILGSSLPSERDRMLISTDKIVTVQPFDEETFQKFNPSLAADDIFPF